MFDARKLRSLIARSEMNVGQIAAACKISRATLSDIKNGHHAPQAATAGALAKFFGVSVDDLYSNDSATATDAAEEMLLAAFRKLNPDFKRALIAETEMMIRRQGQTLAAANVPPVDPVLLEKFLAAAKEHHGKAIHTRRSRSARGQAAG